MVVIAPLFLLPEAAIFAFSPASYNVSEGDSVAEVCVVLISGTTVAELNTSIDIFTQTDSAGRELEVALLN